MTSNVTNIVPTGDLEKHGLLTSGIRLFTVPLLNALPSSVIKKMMRRSSRDASTVVARGGSTHALEAMYTRYQRRIFAKGVMRGMADAFWHHVVSQPKALRNRLKIVRNALNSSVRALLQERNSQGSTEPVRILSIAGGSSRSIIQMILDLKKEGITHEIEVVTLDKDQSALDVGEKLATDADVSSSFHWVCGNARDVQVLVPGKKFDIIEIVGLLDYFDDERTRRLLGVARDVMASQGTLIAANVMPNSEVPFVHKTGWPQMVYRTEKSFRNLFESSGFVDIETVVEPLKVHCVVIAKK